MIKSPTDGVALFIDKICRREVADEREVADVDINTVAPNIPRLSEKDSALLEGSITFAEAVAAPRHMKNKRPGPDGFTVEFFKCFFSDIGAFFPSFREYKFSG